MQKDNSCDITEKIEYLFSEWIKRDLKSIYDDEKRLAFLRDEEQFVRDGMLPTASEWENMASPKILFILKEPSNELSRLTRGKDIPKCINPSDWEEIIKSHSLCDLFKIGRKGAGWHFNALGRWAYSLQHCKEEVRYDKAQANKDRAFLQTAVMNLKKTPAKDERLNHESVSCNDRRLREYVLVNKDFIKSEIEIISPDIVICCGSGVFNFVMMAMGYTNEVEKEFYKSKNKLFLRVCHPQIANKTNFADLLNIYKKSNT